MALYILCDSCRKELKEPGALLFSPPEAIKDFVVPITAKRHFCNECYYTILDFMLGK